MVITWYLPWKISDKRVECLESKEIANVVLEIEEEEQQQQQQERNKKEFRKVTVAWVCFAKITFSLP